MTARDEAGEREAFDSWWSQEGQYLDADYTEKTFAWKAWLARASQPATPGEALREALTRARAANERDRSAVAKARSGVMEQISRYSWVGEGRGPYEWDDDEYRKEFGHAMDAIEKALEPLKKIGSDLTDCPETYEEAIDARSRMPAPATPGEASGEVVALSCEESAWAKLLAECVEWPNGVATVNIGKMSRLWTDALARIPLGRLDASPRAEGVSEPGVYITSPDGTPEELARDEKRRAVERAREKVVEMAKALRQADAAYVALHSSVKDDEDAHAEARDRLDNLHGSRMNRRFDLDAATNALLAAEAERGDKEGV